MGYGDVIGALTAASPAEDGALRDAAELLDLFRDLDPARVWRVQPLPSLDAHPDGSRYRLLCDCEMGDPVHWREVVLDGVDLRAGDGVVAGHPPKRSTASARAPAALDGPLGIAVERCRQACEAVASLRAAQGRTLRGLAGEAAAAARKDLLALSERHRALLRAHHVLQAFAGAGFRRPRPIARIPYLDAGFYDLHLAVDRGSLHPRDWVEVRDDGTTCPLGAAGSAGFDVFSGYLVVREGG